VRIGIFSDGINIPPKEGINVHAYNVAVSLASLPDTEVLLIDCDRGWLDLDALKNQPFDTLVLPNADFYDHEKIAKVIQDYSLDVLQTYMVYFASTVLGRASYETQKPMCVEFHDLEKTIAPIYMSDKNEIAFYDKLQRQAGCLASFVRVMSAYDYAYIKEAWPELERTVAWMPVNIKDPNPTLRIPEGKDASALFIGNTSYPPNAAAATYIEQQLAPKLLNVKFSLVGRGSERFSGVNLTAHGMIDDLNVFLQTHSIGLAPIFEGSGMKIKLLDYLSAGLPVMTTRLGAYGYPDSEAIIVEDDMDEWPAIIEKLLQDKGELKRRATIARKVFLDNFDLGRNINKLADTYRQLKYAPVKTPQDFPELPVDQTKIYWLREIRETPRPPITTRQFFKSNK
jgi:glycosyltransferase involved in cell wall biosynthesis